MTKAADGLTTAKDHETMSRRRALSMMAIVVASPAVAAGVHAGLNVEPYDVTEVAKLYAQWQAAEARSKALCAASSAADARYQAIRPDVPAVIRPENVPVFWRQPLRQEGFSGPNAFVASPNWPHSRVPGRDLTNVALRHELDDWLRSALKASAEFEAAEDAAKVISGTKVNDDEIDAWIDELSDLQRQLAAAVATSIADVQMKVLAVQSYHDGVEIGPLEEALFASILALPSSFNRGA